MYCPPSTLMSWFVEMSASLRDVQALSVMGHFTSSNLLSMIPSGLAASHGSPAHTTSPQSITMQPHLSKLLLSNSLAFLTIPCGHTPLELWVELFIEKFSRVSCLMLRHLGGCACCYAQLACIMPEWFYALFPCVSL